MTAEKAQASKNAEKRRQQIFESGKMGLWLRRWQQRQEVRRDWISFRDAADRHVATFDESPGNDSRRGFFETVRKAILRGEFDLDGHSRAVLVYVDDSPNLITGRRDHSFLRMTPKLIRGFAETHGEEVTDEVYIAFGWAPRDLLRRFYDRHGVAWPKSFDPGALNIASASKDSRSVKPRGAKVRFDWEKGREECLRLMDYHGEFSVADTEWRLQADLERELHDFYFGLYGENAPGESTLREKIKYWLAEWREARKARKARKS